ncbi:cupin domain-containing protein [Limibacillus halophilus]
MPIQDIILFGPDRPEPFEDKPDPSRVLAGAPSGLIWNYHQSADQKLLAGILGLTPGKTSVAYDFPEFGVVTQGRARLADESGAERELAPGDAFVIPAGFKGSWESLEPTEKHYCIYMQTEEGANGRTLAQVTDFQAPLPAPEEGAPAPEKVLEGNPKNLTWNLYESPDERLFCGLWESGPGKWAISYEESEYCRLLTGHSRLADEQGQTLELSPGTAFFIPPGFKGTWEVLETTRKQYVIFA